MSDIQQYLEQHKQDFERDLAQLLRIPSVSADSRHKADVQKAAEWVHQQFQQLGLPGELIQTSGHPLVYAETPKVEGAPVALVYGHYDVQPPDPLNEWVSPPFEPTIRDGNIYARGATDDKGQMLTHIKSVEAWIKTKSRLPLQVKFLIEGEEEVGATAILEYLQKEHDRLACDVIVISDSSQFAPGKPAITYGLRGIAYFELHVSGPKQDLHSGTFGGGVINPAIALSQILSGLVDKRGRIQIPGFYDEVVALDDRERKEFAALPFDESQFMQQLGIDAVGGEEGFTTLERRWARPTFDVNGLWSGYQGEGSKTVLPCRAGAKFSFRLVPNQHPDKIAEGLRKKIADLCPRGVRWELIDMHGAVGYLASLDSPYMKAAEKAIEEGFGSRPVFIREGGSIPIVTEFKNHLRADSLLLGWGLDDDNTHSPNEKFCLADFHRGIRASAALWHHLGQVKAKK